MGRRKINPWIDFHKTPNKSMIINPFVSFPGGSSPLLTDLVAHWQLEETSGTRVDAHAANDLGDVNTVTSGTGKVGTNAALFVGSSDEYLTLADNTDLSLSTDTPFTIAFWLWFDIVTGTGSSHNLISKAAAATGTSVEYNVRQVDADKIRLVVGNGSSSQTVTRTWSPVVDTWYFIVAWHDPDANTLNICVDNDTPTSIAWSGGTQDGTAPFNMATFNNSVAGTLFTGMLDSVSIWKRVLTSDERTELYNSGAGLDYPFS